MVLRLVGRGRSVSNSTIASQESANLGRVEQNLTTARQLHGREQAGVFQRIKFALAQACNGRDLLDGEEGLKCFHDDVPRTREQYQAKTVRVSGDRNKTFQTFLKNL